MGYRERESEWLCYACPLTALETRGGAPIYALVGKMEYMEVPSAKKLPMTRLPFRVHISVRDELSTISRLFSDKVLPKTNFYASFTESYTHLHTEPRISYLIHE